MQVYSSHVQHEQRSRGAGLESEQLAWNELDTRGALHLQRAPARVRNFDSGLQCYHTIGAVS